MRQIVITGGSRGIGAAAVRLFTSHSDQVTFFYEKDHASAQAVAQETGAIAVCCDVTDEDQVAAAFASLSQVDVLINNAGIADYDPINWTKPARFRRVMDVNVTGAFLCAQAALPFMLQNQRGIILNLSSMWGLVGASCEVAYSASKAAVIGMTKALAKELGPSGIRVNAVAPGVILTDMVKNVSDETLDVLRQESALEQLGTPQDIADALWFLASDQARFITGEVLSVNGGLVI
jgi:3-oxoacyl-[acyl-carrier protein] reductase